MVQFLNDPGKNSFIEGLQETLPDALSAFMQRRRQGRERSREDSALQDLGVKSKGIIDPKMRQALLENKLDESSRVAKDLKTQEEMTTVRGLLGDEAADLWPLLTEGSKTSFFEKIFKERERGVGLREAVARYVAENPDSLTSGQEGEEIPLKDQNIEKTTPVFRPKPKNYDVGLTKEESFKRQEKRYDKNLPLYQENEQKLRASEEEADLIQRLRSLNESAGLPKSFGRLNLNPVTGDLLLPAISSPEAQLYVKTVNEFGRKAKETYGSRVTNFEFDRFLKRLPTLANSEEGRRLILEQMDYFNQINAIHNQEVENIVEEHGGLRKIDWDEAERQARNRSKQRIKPLKDRFNAAWKQSEDLYNYEQRKKQQSIPQGYILMYDAEGNELHVPQEEEASALQSGARRAIEE